MKQQIQIIVIVAVLVVLGVGATIYKHIELGFPLLPGKKEMAWTVEATISFIADGGPVQISVNTPDPNDAIAVLGRKSIAEGYSFERKGSRAVWRAADVSGRQKIFFRSTAYRRSDGGEVSQKEIEPAAVIIFSGAHEVAADHIVTEALGKETSELGLARAILVSLNDPINQDASLLLTDADEYGGKVNLACSLLNRAGVKSRSVKGLNLAVSKKKQKLRSFIEIQNGRQVQLINPRTAELENRDQFLQWQHGSESILEIMGGTGGKIRYSTLTGEISAQRAAVQHGRYSGSKFIDFSIYSLPVSQQNTFKLLLLIPIGALIIVILRNLVGVQTSGTFMPILIALVFLQVNLLAGLSLFIIIVGIGLILRYYLSSLNLLLVPRISAVLVFVIIIYVAISVISIKMGIEAGLRVTFFPMIIISWTIERMSVLWEEEGPRDVFIQGGGSLFSASIIFLVMKNPYVGHLTYSFPELLLVVLAVIIMIGSYSGYRLTELRRFEPLSGGK
ncbi:inactive transglutaminase family protein [Desulfotalea psychrophila]|uniref:Gonadoliberin III-related protein n=1 Tax=Desulfotalea psychrophila (strain LSv54 / DSM 12343) TaxID=177439 RepID=Q6AKR8_DESPS|nr:inactive transglutaminase family protein [Desulfotalea psychrophila]CAG37057.1 conserved hypothetical protein [Desulfotalea psychrophila LSv54]